MRISVPTIPHVVLNTSKPISTTDAIDRVASFLAPGNVAVLTGAGVSVDSGIRAYRGKDGRYMNPNYKPLFHHELMDESAKGHAFRQRYWLRSYLGYPPVRDALPNPTHFALAALQHSTHVSRLITQNVDGLHHKAISPLWNRARISEQILELHGTLHVRHGIMALSGASTAHRLIDNFSMCATFDKKVHCNRGHGIDRNTFQEWLSASNPQWADYAAELERTGSKPRTNPDGDVSLEGVSYDDFIVPNCPSCLLENKRNNVHKPEVIFFGESISPAIKDRSHRDIETCDRLFLIGTTLATYSAFRLLKHAVELSKPVLMLNVGPTRADGIAGLEKIELPSGVVLRDAVRALLGMRALEDPVLVRMLSSGTVKPPEDGEDDRVHKTAR